MIVIKPTSVSLPGVLASANVADSTYPAQDLTKLYIAGDRVYDSGTHLEYESKLGKTSTVLISQASPGVVTWAAHGLAVNTPIQLTTSGALPLPLVAGTVYYVGTVLDANTFQVAATPAGSSIVTTSAGSGTHTARASTNYGMLLTDTTNWLSLGATNRWRMFDTYNNTQTTNPDAITVSLLASQLCQGLYLGNTSADSVTVTIDDPVDGRVYNNTASLLVSNSGSSLYGWMFNPLRRKSYFVSVTLPPFSGATITVTISKVGGTAKCGVCVLGTLLDVGLSQYGLGTDIKDYSTTKFDFDGTSTTTARGYSRRMTIDVELKNDEIDYVQENLADLRQVNCVYVGTTARGSAILFGKYSSFKNIISDYATSKMSLQIEGTV